MHEGDHFGEVALRDHVLRTASVVCSKDSSFLVLNHKAYDSILSNPYKFSMTNIQRTEFSQSSKR